MFSPSANKIRHLRHPTPQPHHDSNENCPVRATDRPLDSPPPLLPSSTSFPKFLRKLQKRLVRHTTTGPNPPSLPINPDNSSKGRTTSASNDHIARILISPETLIDESGRLCESKVVFPARTANSDNNKSSMKRGPRNHLPRPSPSHPRDLCRPPRFTDPWDGDKVIWYNNHDEPLRYFIDLSIQDTRHNGTGIERTLYSRKPTCVVPSNKSAD